MCSTCNQTEVEKKTKNKQKKESVLVKCHDVHMSTQSHSWAASVFDMYKTNKHMTHFPGPKGRGGELLQVFESAILPQGPWLSAVALHPAD